MRWSAVRLITNVAATKIPIMMEKMRSICRKMLKQLVIVSLLATLCFAQKESLLIGPGDMLHVQVFDTPEMEQHVRVTDSGEIPLMFIGSLKVAGLTPTAASHAIEKALIDKQYMREPQVTVIVDQFATQNVSVLGEVLQPGVFPIATGISILKV